MKTTGEEIADKYMGHERACVLQLNRPCDCRHGELASAIDAALASERESVINECCNAIRAACNQCENGHASRDPNKDAECEYCGRPIQAIRFALARVPAAPPSPKGIA